MMMYKFICKLLGHKKGFIHRKNETDIYCCKRCGQIVYEERTYELRNKNLP